MTEPHYGCCSLCGARRVLVREKVRNGTLYRWLRCPRCGLQVKPPVFEDV